MNTNRIATSFMTIQIFGNFCPPPSQSPFRKKSQVKVDRPFNKFYYLESYRMFDLYKWYTPSNSIGIWLKSCNLRFTSNSLRGSWWTTRQSILCCSGSTWRTLRRLSPPVTGTTSSPSSTGSSSARPQSKVLPLLLTLEKNHFY